MSSNKNHVVLVFEKILVGHEECLAGLNMVVGPFTEREAEEYIPNPAPKHWVFAVVPLEDGSREFQG